MRKKWLALSAVAIVALAGCSSSHKAAAPTTSSTTVVAVATTVATVVPSSSSVAPVTTVSPPTTAASATTVARATTTVPSGPGPCLSTHLAGSLGGSQGAAGSVYYPLVLRNTGTSTCTLYGYPGVSFVAPGSGQQVGAPADRRPGTVQTISLAPGQSAQATLAVTDAANFPPSCGITTVAGLRVYPPGQTAALYIPHPDRACANPTDVTLHVGPLIAG